MHDLIKRKRLAHKQGWNPIDILSLDCQLKNKTEKKKKNNIDNIIIKQALLITF